MLPSSATFLSFFLLSTEIWTVSAKRRTGHRKPSIMDNTDDDIINKLNDRYTVNLTVGDTTVNVILDTGSTDLWVAPPGGIGSFKSTGVPGLLAFGDGSTFVNGTIGLGEVAIAGFKITDQAFLNVTENVGFEFECTGQGICGLVGLGFDGPTSAVITTLNNAGKDGAEVGKSVLSSIFEQNPDKGRFYALSLSRLGDKRDSADASLDIGQLDEKYASVQDAPILSQFPFNSSAWSTLADGLSVNGVSIPWTSSVTGAPAGQTVVLLDSGTTNILVPRDVRDAIYSAVPGAVLARNSSIPNPHFSEDEDVWIIPCGTAIRMSAALGGQRFRIHPLDLTDMVFLLGPDSKNHTICIGSITNGGAIATVSRDALFGDSFLRNVYTVFSFGNETTPPHMQLLSQTDKGASADFARVRARLLRDSPPELPPADIIQLFDGVPSSATGKVSTNLADTDVASGSTDSQVAKYAPIVIGLLGANLLLLLVLVLFGVLSLVRKGRSVGSSPQYVPVKLREEGHGGEERSYSDGPH